MSIIATIQFASGSSGSTVVQQAALAVLQIDPVEEVSILIEWALNGSAK